MQENWELYLDAARYGEFDKIPTHIYVKYYSSIKEIYNDNRQLRRQRVREKEAQIASRELAPKRKIPLVTFEDEKNTKTKKEVTYPLFKNLSIN